MSNSDDDSASSRNKSTWLSRMSRSEQIVAALIGAIITGIFGIGGAIIASSSGSSHILPGAANHSRTTVTASPPPSAEPSPTSSSDTVITIRHEGRVHLAGIPIQLDSTAANWNAGSSYHDLEGGGALSKLIFDNPAFLLSASDASSYSTCANSTHYALNLSAVIGTPNAGERFCVITNENRYSLIEILSYSFISTTPSSDFTFNLDITTWEPQTAG